MMRMRAIQMLVRPRVTVSDDDVRARYDSMTRRSSQINKVHLHLILIALPRKPTEEQLAAAKAKAALVIEKARAGEDFRGLAAQYSDDKATKDDGGDLGLIERGTMPTEWEAVVFSMEKGEVRGPVSGPEGLHVFYVSELAKSDLKPFDELKEEIRNELYRKEMDKQTTLWLNDLRRKAHIVKL
jgi:parvulin-like peptidyl-prolyl isomerase